jgi:3-deoxy-7-phosphoheptulonate synthase
MEEVAKHLASLSVPFMRGGAFKPRTSPYSFQGLGVEGLRMLHGAAKRHGLRTVTEVTDTRTVSVVAELADVLQVGARNMFNYELLKEVGRAGKPVLLKRGFSATADELLQAAEYMMLAGCEDVILCERGIRTFSRRTRNTLDISVVPLLRRLSRLPVVVDPSHAAGRKDVLVDLTAAAFAAGAHGVMIEVHPDPAQACSDQNQQLDLDEFASLVDEVRRLSASRLPAGTRPQPASQEGVATS